LRIIQEISGHRNLEQLQRYLEVKPEQVRGAMSALSMLSHEGGEYVGKRLLHDLPSNLPQSGHTANQQRLDQ
jgi:integrase/recombinase XerD